MSERMKWLLMLMLVSLSRSWICRDNGNCSCQLFKYGNYEIQCPSESDPKFIARFNIFEDNCHIECHNATSWSEFGWQLNPSYVERAATFKIERCPLPDESFKHIMRRFGFTSAFNLKFTSHMNLSTTLTRQHFSMLPKLKILDLSSNGLTELPSDLFRDLDALDYLDLSFNKMAMLPRHICHDLSGLLRLDLSNNAIEFVDWRLFGNCTRLHQLSLRGNLLTSLDHRTSRYIKRLSRIDLADNFLETLLPDTFEYTKLRELDISGNTFCMLPEELLTRTNLTKFTFSHNRGNLTTLLINFLNNATELEEVILIRNNLTSLPENIFWGSFSVERIDLHGNALSKLPKNIFRDSRALVHLDLSDNGLNYVPEGLFGALGELRRLNLARNGIARLSADIFRNLGSLHELDLEINNITDIHPATFDKLQRIQLIRLSHNSVDLRTFCCRNLRKHFFGSPIRKIFLDHNNLTGEFLIEEVNYDHPADLELIDLTHNQISVVRVWSSLSGSSNVKYDLRHNNLQFVEIRFDVSSEVNILVDDNPLHCGCHLYTSLKYMHVIRKPQSGKNLQIILGNASCSEPYWMKGIQVASLRLETFTCRLDNDDGHQRCAEGCDCWWRPHDETRIVNCSSRNLAKMPDEIIKFVHGNVHETLSYYVGSYFPNEYWIRWFDWYYSPVELDLTNNSLTEIPPMNGYAFGYVKKLLLSHNNILKLSFDVLPPGLETLHLDHNNLERFDQVASNAIINAAALKELNLEGNPWNCASDTRSALYSMKNKLGSNLTYSMKDCLDYRNPPNIKKTSTLYISYTIF